MIDCIRHSTNYVVKTLRLNELSSVGVPKLVGSNKLRIRMRFLAVCFGPITSHNGSFCGSSVLTVSLSFCFTGTHQMITKICKFNEIDLDLRPSFLRLYSYVMKIGIMCSRFTKELLACLSWYL